MIGINSNINSLVAQQNLNGSQSALSSAITRLSSGKRINSAADDAAGQAIASRMTSQINGLNQGVSNSNDGVSMTQTASSGLNQITDSLQRIRTLAVQAASGSLSSTDQAALQKEVTQRIAEVNRIASQTQYNGKNVLDGSAGNVSFQVGANVGQTISVDLSQGVSASKLGTGLPAANTSLGTISGLSLDSTGAATTGKASITAINVAADGKGGFTFTDQNNQALSGSVSTALFGSTASTTGTGTALTLVPQGALSGTTTKANAAAAALTAVGTTTTSGINFNNVNNTTTAPGAAGALLGTISGVSLDANGAAVTGSAATITSITVKTDGAGGFSYTDQNGGAIGATAVGNLFSSTAASTTAGSVLSLKAGGPLALASNVGYSGGANPDAATAGIALANVANVPPKVSDIDISTSNGASAAIESIDNALNSVNGIQAALGAAQNRFSSIATTQTAQSTNLSSAQSQITDANFAQETANLSKAQVLQQAGISVLAQANSLPQQVLKLLG
ncbi:flagellin [Burkholderia sp. PAMC 28687]|uniref:Flagellin n=1 Tax=Caballeronia sordidicola TaxID=196367 RepID=A0A242N1T3_CABSO|nr:MULTISPECIES: flagellin [Burkholderiaceae]AMM14692.1 flagellin [Burkholderia sp. PAMC 28687]OTP77639.1 Flagellar biosynthesis protein FliC [Caballeronia sordidicola]